MKQCDTQSSTAGTQPPSQGQHLSRVHPSHTIAQQAGDNGTVGHPGTVQCRWDTGMRLSKSETALSRPRSLVRQRQAGHSATTTISHHVGCQRSPDLELLKKAKMHVKTAIKEKKIFMVQGPYPTIRRTLQARGWVERKLPSRGRQMEQHRGGQNKQQLETGTSNGGGGQGKALLNPRGWAEPFLGTTDPLRHAWPPAEEEEEEQCDEDPSGIHDLMSHLVQDQRPNFIWTRVLEPSVRKLLQQDQVVNHYPRVDAFTTKEGLCLSLQNLPWIEQADPNTFFPRCYRLATMDDQEAFIEDFRLTAARSLLKLALEEAGDRLMGTTQVPNFAKGAARPGFPLYHDLVEDALEVCKQHLGVLQHHDIDRNTPSPCRTCINWDRFLQDYYRVAHEGAGLVLTSQQQKQCQDLLQLLAEQLPQLGMEGKLNIWILKPGITCITRLEEVLQLARGCTAPVARVGRWVVQKYVEQLLTIFGTKFDIRQWFVVTDWKPLTVWFYQDCYLRFCSRPFSLRHLERARHLCNVSVQKWYKTSPKQDPRVPHDKIWSNKQFQEYLAQLGQADAWHQVLVPGMKAAIVNALRSAQDQVGFRKGSFELYGADFLVGEDCQPWLLEINSCPTMSPSSAVTRQLCANVQRDTLRLVLDRKDNPTCSIGAFELIYKEAAVPKPLSTCVKLMVKGHALKKPRSAQHRVQNQLRTAAPNAHQHPVLPQATATTVPKRAQYKFLTTVPIAPKLPATPAARAMRVPKQAQHRFPITVPRAPKLPTSPGGRTTQVTQRAQHRSPAPVLSASEPLVFSGGRTTQVPQRAQHQSPTTVPSASKLPVSPGGRATQVPQPRATWKLRSLEQRINCSSPSSDSPAPPKPQASSAGSQELPCLDHLPRQPQAAQSQINSCPLDWVPVPPPRGSPSNPWLSRGCARSPPAKPRRQPLSAQSTRTPCLEQKRTAAPNGMQKSWFTEMSPEVDPPVLAEPTPQYLAASQPKEVPLLCRGTHLLPHARFKTIMR